MKKFIILWVGQSISSLGSGMTAFALIVWIYSQKGTATSVTMLSFFTYLPSILFCFIAGTLADKWDKKKTMLVSDFIAAIGTSTVFILYATGNLEIWHLYVVNFVIGLMGAFQSPASSVAFSLIVPKDKYVKASGMQGFSGSLNSILTPILATSILAFGGLEVVFTVDLITFAIAFSSLLLFIKVPKIHLKDEKKEGSFLKNCLEGLEFLKNNRALFQLILYMSLINLLAYLGGFGILPAMILARTGGNETILGMVSSGIGIGMLFGSILVILMKPSKRKTRLIFLTMAISFFLGDIFWGLGKNSIIWILASFGGNMLVPFTTSSMATIMRINVPLEMQGRVFSARDTLQYFTIPIAFFIGGLLSDNVLEPFMAGTSNLRNIFSMLVGTGKGSGMAILFLFTGIVGVVSSLINLRNPIFKNLD